MRKKMENISNDENGSNNQERVQPILKLKPRFTWLTAVSFKQLGTVATIIFIGVLFSKNNEVNIKYFLIILVIYIFYLVVNALVQKRRYERTSYLFFGDSILILKKYGKQERIIIPYRDIQDILFYQNYVQKLLKMGGLGIKISTSKWYNNVVMLESIDDLNGTIEKIRLILYPEK